MDSPKTCLGQHCRVEYLHNHSLDTAAAATVNPFMTILQSDDELVAVREMKWLLTGHVVDCVLNARAYAVKTQATINIHTHLLIELRFCVPPDTKQVISDTFFQANVSA